jgi:hypothetical protein
VYGHSYLRQVFDNFVVASEPDVRRRVTFDRVNDIESLQYTEVARDESMGHNMLEMRWRDLNTTVFAIINSATVQDPESLGELKRFLAAVGHFDIAVFMVPHGVNFNVYMALKEAGKDTGDSKPVDLATMTSDGVHFEQNDLANIFHTAADSIVQVMPWKSLRSWEESGRRLKHLEARKAADNISHVLWLDEYVHASLGDKTPFHRKMCAISHDGEYPPVPTRRSDPCSR